MPERIPQDEVVKVLRMLADGFATHEIAASMFLSERAIKYRITAILKMLGATTRTQAVAIAYDKELLKPSKPLGRPPKKQAPSINTMFYRPEMLSDRLGYPMHVGDEEWNTVKHLYHVVDNKWKRREHD